MAPRSYWWQHAFGEAIAIAVVVSWIAGLAWLARRSRLATVGVVGFALFLAPPLLTRAAVSGLNFPSLRQLYLPVLIGAPPLIVVLIGAQLRARVAIPIIAWAATLAVESQISGGTLDFDRGRRLVTESTARILAGVPGDSTVVAVGSDLCSFAPSLIWSGPSVLAIPSPSRSDAAPALTAVDDHTLIARSDVGFDIRAEPEVPLRDPGVGPGAAWVPYQPTELVLRGAQHIAGATVTIEAGEGARITALRYRFERPVAKLVFIRFRGCSEPEQMVLAPDHR